MSTKQRQLKPEVEICHLQKLTPEERRTYLRKQTFRELKEMERERRTREAQEVLQRCRREKEEREKERERLREEKERFEEERRKQEAELREEEEWRASEQQKHETLSKERLQWRQVMIVEEDLILDDLNKEQQKRDDEAELHPLQETEVEAKSLIPELKIQIRWECLYNNWVGEQITERFSAEKTRLKSRTATLRSNKPGLRSDEDQDQVERQSCKLQECYIKAFKDRCSSHLYEQFKCRSRNRILKKSIF